MKKIIGILMVFALVITMIPIASSAMPNDNDEAVHAENSEGHDCHRAEKTTQNNDASDKCCDKGVCKCVGGTCHNFSKLFGNNGNYLFAVTASSAHFAFADDNITSASPDNLKRPPRA